MEKVFNVNGWGDAWRNGIYDFVHYHSMTHEVLGVAQGLGHATARRQQGSDRKGRHQGRRSRSGRRRP